MTRFVSTVPADLPLMGIDLGYSARNRSCGLAFTGNEAVQCHTFGHCLERVVALIAERGAHILVIEAVLSTYHRSDGNPDVRGVFEKGRGWYHGPGVTTFAAALRFLTVLDERLPKGVQLPVVEGFLSYKSVRTAHTEDARRLIAEFAVAHAFSAAEGSQPITSLISGVPEIRRYNTP